MMKLKQLNIRNRVVHYICNNFGEYEAFVYASHGISSLENYQRYMTKSTSYADQPEVAAASHVLERRHIHRARI